MRLSSSPEEMRSFVAIELPEQVKDGLASLRGELKRAEHSFVKWVGPEGVHLTLKFLGNIPAIQVTEISDTIAAAARGVPPFRLEVARLGAFPNLKQPRVLWVGIRGELTTLLQLQQNIDSGLTALGFTQEERPFAPHLTLARLRQTASPAERKAFGELAASASFETGYPFDAKAVSLMRSQLTPGGAIYTRLSVIELQA